MKHISFLVADMKGGGIERTALTLAQEFASRGHVAEILALRNTGELSNIVPDNVRFTCLNKPNYPKSIMSISQHLYKSSVDTLITASPLANVFGLIAARVSSHGGLRKGTDVITMDAADPNRTYFTDQKIKSSFIRAAARILYPTARARVAVSEGVNESLIKAIALKPNSVTTIYNPVELTPSSSEPVHEWLGPGREFPVAIAAGRLHPVKNYPFMIKAIKRSVERGFDIRLVIFGEGSERSILDSLIKDEGLGDYVRLAGFSHSIRAEMAAADCFLMTSHSEGLGNSLIEALAEGCPVISVDCPYGPREILEGGRHGALIAPGDLDAMSRAIEASTLNDRDSVSQEHLSRFDLKYIASQFENIILEP